MHNIPVGACCILGKDHSVVIGGPASVKKGHRHEEDETRQKQYSSKAKGVFILSGSLILRTGVIQLFH
jgi:hypothetical protein